MDLNRRSIMKKSEVTTMLSELLQENNANMIFSQNMGSSNGFVFGGGGAKKGASKGPQPQQWQSSYDTAVPVCFFAYLFTGFNAAFSIPLLFRFLGLL
ncbi:unnamed protein product [Heterosigma akashiwo]